MYCKSTLGAQRGVYETFAGFVTSEHGPSVPRASLVRGLESVLFPNRFNVHRNGFTQFPNSDVANSENIDSKDVPGTIFEPVRRLANVNV